MSMRAAVYDRVGPAAEVLSIRTLPRPTPGRGEVLVRIHASGINPSDVKRRSGWRGRTSLEVPIVPHSDGAGIVEAVGVGVDASWAGRRVWLWSIPAKTFLRDGIELGTAAEYVVAPVENVVELPSAASFEVGACLGIPALTAHFAVFADGPVEDRYVLVQGGAGAVGETAIAFAKSGGARVIATVSSREKAEIARRAGADHVIDRHRDDVAAGVLAIAPAGVDRIVEVDFGANIRIDSEVIANGGVIASYSSPSRPEPEIPYYPLQLKSVLIRLVSSYTLTRATRQSGIDATTRLLEGGSLEPTIASRLPLAGIAAAHEAVESAKRPGRILLTL